ncbi:hypothetical protein [Mesorhizobium wenxiniae]|nr:hypothetical protein [Mesorhizobium wenxiniae]
MAKTQVTTLIARRQSRETKKTGQATKEKWCTVTVIAFWYWV